MWGGKSDAGRHTIPLPDWLILILQENTARYGPGRARLIFPYQVGMPLRRTLFRSGVWRPTLIKAGLLGTVTELEAVTDSGDRYRASWTTDTGNTATTAFHAYAQAVKHVARPAGQALRFHNLRHFYATWLVDDEVSPNMVQPVMGHEHVSTTLQLYVRRTEHHDRIRQAPNTAIVVADDADDHGTTGALVPI